MDDTTKKAIDEAADRAAQHALDAVKPYFDEKVEEAAERAAKKVRSHFDATKDEIIREIKALGEGENLQDERLDEHGKRIERLEGHAGLPALEPAVE